MLVRALRVVAVPLMLAVALAVLILAPALMLTDTLGILAVPALAVALMLAILILAPALMLAIGLVTALDPVGEPRVLVGPPIPQILPQIAPVGAQVALVTPDVGAVLPDFPVVAGEVAFVLLDVAHVARDVAPVLPHVLGAGHGRPQRDHHGRASHHPQQSIHGAFLLCPVEGRLLERPYDAGPGVSIYRHPAAGGGLKEIAASV